MLAPVFVLFVSLAQNPAPADAVSAQARLDRASAFQEQLDYDEALLELNVLLTDSAATEAERFEAHLMAGVVARIMEKDVEARGHFLYVLQSRPDYNLPPDTSPKVKSFFELVRLEVDRPAAAAAPLELEPPPPPAQAEAEAEAPLPSRDEAVWWPWAAGGGAAVVLAGIALAVGAGGVATWLMWPQLFPADEKPDVTLGRHDLSSALVLVGAAFIVMGPGTPHE